TTFDDRKNAYESKFAHDQEAQFKLMARRNKLLGLWAAEKLHLKADEQQAYAQEVVQADIQDKGEDDVVQKIMDDFEKAGLNIEEHEVREMMHNLLQTAQEQLSEK
ncbi:MAG: DUF1476 domain-containing protein, partial [Rickettsiales bacterium]